MADVVTSRPQGLRILSSPCSDIDRNLTSLTKMPAAEPTTQAEEWGNEGKAPNDYPLLNQPSLRALLEALSNYVPAQLTSNH